MLKIGIVGGTGYTGVELLRILSQHPEVSIQAITSRKEAGIGVAELFPNLRGRVSLKFCDPAEAGSGQMRYGILCHPQRYRHATSQIFARRRSAGDRPGCRFSYQGCGGMGKMVWHAACLPRSGGGSCLWPAGNQSRQNQRCAAHSESRLLSYCRATGIPALDRSGYCRSGSSHRRCEIRRLRRGTQCGSAYVVCRSFRQLQGLWRARTPPPARDQAGLVSCGRQVRSD